MGKFLHANNKKIKNVNLEREGGTWKCGHRTAFKIS